MFSFFDFLEKLREKPEMARRRILVGATFSITAVIFFIWLSVRLYSPADENVANVVKSRDNGPLAEISQTLGKFGESISEGVAAIKTVISSTTASATPPVSP